MPVAKTRSRSTVTRRATSSTTRVRKATSSTSWAAARPQRPPSVFQVGCSPSGWTTTKPARSASSGRLYDAAACSALPPPAGAPCGPPSPCGGNVVPPRDGAPPDRRGPGTGPAAGSGDDAADPGEGQGRDDHPDDEGQPD